MNVIYEERQRGKTTKLLELANKHEGYNLIVCCSMNEVNRLWGIILEKKYNLPQPITFDDFLKRNYCGYNVANLFIDNVDLLLHHIATANIGGITINKDNGNSIEE